MSGRKDCVVIVDEDGQVIREVDVFDSFAAFCECWNQRHKGEGKRAMIVQREDERLEVLQQWECIVLELRDGYVHCQLHDLTDESNPVEFAEVLLSEFNEYDRPILSEGSVFYWTVGYIHQPNGQVRRSSQLRVRRPPPAKKSPDL